MELNAKLIDFVTLDTISFTSSRYSFWPKIQKPEGSYQCHICDISLVHAER